MLQNSMMIKAIKSRKNNHDTIVCASDKSLTHRSIMFSSLAQGKSVIENPLLGADCLSTVSCFQKLGVKIEINENNIIVDSVGSSSFKSPSSDLDCGNSGTTSRLLLGLLSGIDGLKARLTGDSSLESRPMARVTDHLEKAGAEFKYDNDKKTLPITIFGKNLNSCDYSVAQSSAQVKSAILLANLNTTEEITIKLPSGSRDHTENFLKLFNANINVANNNGTETIKYKGPTAIKAMTYKVPVDPSSASFFAVLGLLF